MASKPTVVLVPGSCHTAQHFVSFTTHLREAGFAVVCEKLASVDPPKHARPGMSDDIAFIQHHLLQPLVDQGKDILLVCHSFAGYSGGAAAIDYSKKERSGKGQEGGIVGLIFIAAFLAFKGAEPLGKLPDGSRPLEYSYDEAQGLWTFATPIASLYSPDVPEQLASEAADALRPMALNAVTDISPALTANWASSVYKDSMAYIRCTQDAIVPIGFQDLMLKKSKGNWIIVSMNTSHSPFLSRPAEVIETIASLAQQFAS